MFLEAKATGGTKPYTFQWFDALHRPLDCYTNTGDYQSCEVKALGLYYCTVTEAGGVSRTVRMEVGYEGKYPFIIKQRENVTLPYRNDNWYTADLQVEAYSGSGLAGALAYQWEKKGENGWQLAGFGKSLSLAQDGWEGSIGGLYRCRIFDGATGGEIYTNEVRVQIEFSLAKAVCSSEKGYYGDIVFEFTGGTGPYRVTMLYRNNFTIDDPGLYNRLRWGQWEADGRHVPKTDVPEGGYWVNALADSVRVGIPNALLRWDYAPYGIRWVPYLYKIEIEDAMGRVVYGEYKGENYGNLEEYRIVY